MSLQHRHEQHQQQQRQHYCNENGQNQNLQHHNKTIGQKRFQNPGKNTVSTIIGSYKSAVSKHAHRLMFNFKWQQRFYDRIIKSDDEYKKVIQYIKNNPLNWKN